MLSIWTLLDLAGWCSVLLTHRLLHHNLDSCYNLYFSCEVNIGRVLHNGSCDQYLPQTVITSSVASIVLFFIDEPFRVFIGDLELGVVSGSAVHAPEGNRVRPWHVMTNGPVSWSPPFHQILQLKLLDLLLWEENLITTFFYKLEFQFSLFSLLNLSLGKRDCQWFACAETIKKIQREMLLKWSSYVYLTCCFAASFVSSDMLDGGFEIFMLELVEITELNLRGFRVSSFPLARLSVFNFPANGSCCGTLFSVIPPCGNSWFILHTFFWETGLIFFVRSFFDERSGEEAQINSMSGTLAKYSIYFYHKSVFFSSIPLLRKQRVIFFPPHVGHISYMTKFSNPDSEEIGFMISQRLLTFIPDSILN